MLSLYRRPTPPAQSLVDICNALPEGKYVFVKDPNKSIMRLYEVPADALEDDYSETPIEEAA